MNGNPGSGSNPVTPVAEVTGVSKRFGATLALDRVDLTVTPGQTHGLVGRNGAGKSTLVSILTGLREPDSGVVRLAGLPAPRPADRVAWRALVACVYQRSTIIPELSVAENLFLHRHPRGAGRLIRWPALRREATELLARWSLDIDVRLPARELDVEQRQFVEIARALSLGARFIILDEPTARLDAAAITRLFEHIAELRASGVTFLFISHHLQEIYQICDTVSVYRDARHVLTTSVERLPRAELVAAMTGDPGGAGPAARDRSDRKPSPGPVPRAEPALRVTGLTAGRFRDVSFDVRAGEIVGLAGSGGSGKTEVAETIVGLRRADSGDVRVDGVAPRAGDVPSALAAGVGFVPRDRHQEGLVADMTVADNATMTVLDRLGPAVFVSGRRRDALAREMIGRLDIKTAGPAQPVSDLSGGNQQKVVLARALASAPTSMVLITPTAGVDVRSKDFLLAKVVEIADAGAAVLIASDELDDLRVCDRLLIMFRGSVVGELAEGWEDGEVVAAMEGVS